MVDIRNGGFFFCEVKKKGKRKGVTVDGWKWMCS